MGVKMSHDIAYLGNDRVEIKTKTKTRGFEDMEEKKVYNLRKVQFFWTETTLYVETWKFEKDTKTIVSRDTYEFKNPERLKTLQSKVDRVIEIALSEHQINQ